MDWFLYNCNTQLKQVNASLSLAMEAVYLFALQPLCVATSVEIL